MDSSSAPPSPSPRHLIRSHLAPISVLFLSEDNERIYSGDSSGLVVVTSTRSLRSLASWNAHTDGLLGIQEWGTRVITHGRDNKLHLWSCIKDLPSSSSIRLDDSASVPGLPVPTMCYTMDVNALNYCKFSLLPLDTLRTTNESEGVTTGEALIAIPNLIESSWADIWSLPSGQRLHAAIGKPSSLLSPSLFSSDSERRSKTGILMSLHAFLVPSDSTPSPATSDYLVGELRLLCAYENGGVTMWRYTKSNRQVSVEGVGWEAVWTCKLHTETVMAMAVSKDNALALTVSADHLVGRYDLASNLPPGSSPETLGVAYRTKHPGNAAIALRDDGKVCAVGGWDGKIRLYSTRILKPLGKLHYHKSSCQALAFAHSRHSGINLHTEGGERIDESDEEDEMSQAEKQERSRWLVAGAKDNRISLWALMNFEKSDRGVKNIRPK